MILIHCIGFFLFAYVGLRLILQLPLSAPVRLLLAALALAASQYHLAARAMFGTLASPEMPYPVLVLWSGAFVVLLVTCAVTVFRDVLLLLAFLARKTGLFRSRPFSPGRRAAITAGAGLALGVYGFREGLVAPEVRTSEVVLDRLPPELDGLRIAHLTDLHATALLRRERVEAVVARVNDLEPDLVLCTGDLVDGTVERRAAAVEPLRDLRARYGVFGCEGNHEYYSAYRDWMRAFADLGLKLLHNAHRALAINGKTLVVAGLNDPVGPNFGNPGPDATAALTGAPPEAPVVLLAHRPSLARDNAAHPVDLQLSGHTHGGHILGLDRVVASFNDGFIRGWYTVGRMRLYVSPGTGLWTGFPVRLGVPGEIAHIVLRSPVSSRQA